MVGWRGGLSSDFAGPSILAVFVLFVAGMIIYDKRIRPKWGALRCPQCKKWFPGREISREHTGQGDAHSYVYRCSRCQAEWSFPDNGTDFDPWDKGRRGSVRWLPNGPGGGRAVACTRMHARAGPQTGLSGRCREVCEDGGPDCRKPVRC